MDATTTRLTLEEFLALPDPEDGSKLEFWDGEVVVMPPPGYEHGAIAFEIALRLGTFIRSAKVGGQLLINDAGFAFGRFLVGPDVAWVRLERTPTQRLTRHFPGVPDLAIEVVSPSDLDARVSEKVNAYLVNGTTRVWLVRPNLQSVTVYTSGGAISELRGEQELNSHDAGFPVEGFALRVSDIFASAPA